MERVYSKSMAFPNLIDATVATADMPGRYGPFANGSNCYSVVVKRISNTAFLQAMKSTDKGVTWVAQDTANNPSVGTNQGGTVLYSCGQLGTVIYALAEGASGSDFTTSLFSFDTSTDTWATLTGVQLDNGISFRYCNGFFNLVARATDLIFVAPVSAVNLNGIQHFIPAFAVYDIAGDSWSSFTDLDYSDYAGAPTDWNLLPVGAVLDSDGRVVIATEQITYLDNSGQQTFNPPPGDSELPLDCDLIDSVFVFGAGGGFSGDALSDLGTGGGGGGALAQSNDLTVTPGETISTTIGAGGAVGTDGGVSSFVCSAGTTQADGGKGSPSNLTGGAGGDASISIGDIKVDGGTGGSVVVGGGSGAGGGGAAGANGVDGSEGGTLEPGGAGGAGGAGGGDGGFGASYDGTGTPTGDVGQPGVNPGGGCGGASNGYDFGGLLPFGADGGVTVLYTPTRGSNDGRLFFQAILADNSLGALTNVADGDFPIQSPLSLGIPFPIDLKAGNGFIGVVLSGVNTTNFNENILVGTSPNGDSPAFDFVSLDVAQGGSQSNPSPALAIDVNTGDLYTVFLSCPAPPAAKFMVSVNNGPVTQFGAGNNSAGARIVADFLAAQLQMQFGVPTQASTRYSSPD